MNRLIKLSEAQNPHLVVFYCKYHQLLWFEREAGIGNAQMFGHIVQTSVGSVLQEDLLL